MSALNDLVKAGKQRYVGISDVPAWRLHTRRSCLTFAVGVPGLRYRLSIRCREGESSSGLSIRISVPGNVRTLSGLPRARSGELQQSLSG